MVCIYKLGSRWERFRNVFLLLGSVSVGYLAELRGPEGSG
jgi:hypothetical protein